MTAFDEICSCGYETATHVCNCVRRKWQARDRCDSCLAGRHSLEPRTCDALPPAEPAHLDAAQQRIMRRALRRSVRVLSARGG